MLSEASYGLHGENRPCAKDLSVSCSKYGETHLGGICDTIVPFLKIP